MELCDTCRAFDIQAFSRGKAEYRGYALEEAASAAQAGCSFCSMLIDNLLTVVKDMDLDLLKEVIRRTTGAYKLLSYEHLYSIILRISNMFNPAWIHLSVSRDAPEHSRDFSAANIAALNATLSRDPTRSTGSIRLHVAADSGSPASSAEDIVGKLYTPMSPWSTSNMKDIRDWHLRCRTNHKECSKKFSRVNAFDVEDVPLPTRCIEIIVDKTDPASPVYSHILRHTAGKRGKYTILSHQWVDDTQVCMTINKNLQCVMGQCNTSCGICGGTIPSITNLFQDAGRLSYEIGVDYIWIDSICIVQDDQDDWARESVEMADYYQHAWLTICATTVTTTGGLFGPISNEYSHRITRLPYRSQDGSQLGHFYVQCLERTFLTEDYRKNITKSTILKRGWVYQEWMLSRRLLTLSGAGGFFVQCQQRAPHSLHDDEVLVPTDSEGNAADFSFRKHLGINIDTLNSILDSWNTVVETYSGLELTYMDKDRLVALDGLANEFTTAIQSCGTSARGGIIPFYVSGLWFGSSRGLLWEQAEHGKRERVKGLPSWSWASMMVSGKMDNNKPVSAGMPVRWAWINYPALPIVCEWEEARSVEVDSNFTPQFGTPSVISQVSGPRPKARFNILGLRGRKIAVYVNNYFEEPGDADTAAYMTDHDPKFGRQTWRMVSEPSDPQIITGWASLEHPEFQDEGSCGPNSDIVALVITMRARKWGDYGKLIWWGHPPVSEVLYLRPVTLPNPRDTYERVGVGRLFGDGFHRSFVREQEQLIWLI